MSRIMNKYGKFCLLVIVMMLFVSICLCSCKDDKLSYQGEKEDAIQPAEGVQDTVDAETQDIADAAEQEGKDLFQRTDGTVTTDVEVELNRAKQSDKTIVWITSLFYAVHEEKQLKKFNQLLKEDGYPFEVAFYYVNTDMNGENWNYQENVLKLLEKGYGDICWLGDSIYGKKSYLQNVLVRGGHFMALDSYLQSQKGRGLLDAFHKIEWESARTDGKIRLIPNQNIFPHKSYVAFSKKYFSKENVEKFQGDFTTMKDFISPKMKRELKDHSLIWQLGCTDMLNAMGMYEFMGVWGNHETGEMCAPFSDDRFYRVEKMLWECNREGILFQDMDISDTWTEDGHENILDGKFGIAVFSEEDMYQAVKDEAVIVELPYYYVNATIAGNGILESSQKKEGALKLAELLYGDSKYANAFLLGEEGEDYTVKDGYAYDMQGEKIGGSGRTPSGINDNAYIAEGEDFGPNVRENKQKYFKHCRKSIFIGFQPDSSGWNGDEVKLYDRELKALNVWKEKDFEKAYREQKKKFAKEAEPFRKDLEKQFQKWRELYGAQK